MWSYKKMIDGCNFILKQAVQAQRGSTAIAVLFV
jgi:hypothetical protein